MDNEILKKIISYTILLSVFVTGGMMREGVTIEWYYVLYAVFAGVCFFHYRKFSRRLAIVLAVLTLYSLLTYQYSQALLWKQIINITFSVFVFYNFLNWEKWNIDSIFRKYVTLAKIVLVIGFFQVLAFAGEPYDGGFSRGLFVTIFPFLADTNISVRFQSLTSEPAMLAAAFAPVVFVSLYNITRRAGYCFGRGWSILFITGYILTLSVVAYTGLFAMLLILYFKNFTVRKMSLMVVVFFSLGLLAITLYHAVDGVRLRADDTLYGFSGDITDPVVFKEVNLTTYATLSNAYVTRETVKKFPLTGSGIGSYQVDFAAHLPEDMKNYSQLNRQDAGSLAMRLLAETGIIGFFCFLFFIVRYKIKSYAWFSDDQEFMWLINAGIFVMMVLFLVRSGHYTYQARILFFMLYYLTYRAVRP